MPTPEALQKSPTTAAPIIVTATMGAADFARFDRLRWHYFPPERNLLPAHLTLFHHLPPSVEMELKALLASLANGPRPEAWIEGAMSLGGGVAISLRSPALLMLRARIAEHFQGLLTPQDRAAPRLHVTVQNKVTQAVAQATLAQLRESIAAGPCVIAGLACWHYRGGPWSPIGAWSFRG